MWASGGILGCRGSKSFIRGLSLSILDKSTLYIYLSFYRYKVSPGHVPEELAEDSKGLTKRAIALVELAADSWIVTGRQPLPIMMAAVYLAWQSLKPNAQRLKMSLEKFCKLAKVQKSKTAGTRITEMKGMLYKLGKEIPWYKEVLTPDNVVSLVGDVLQHRFSLLRRALKSHELSLLEKCPAGQVNPSSAETSSSSEVSEDAGQTPVKSSVNAEKEKRGRDGDESLKSPSEESNPQTQELTQNWGKRVLFAPPCVVNAKRKRAERPPLHVTGDEEISDSEIESYIRTPQEARDFAMMQEKLFTSNNESSWRVSDRLHMFIEWFINRIPKIYPFDRFWGTFL